MKVCHPTAQSDLIVEIGRIEAERHTATRKVEIHVGIRSLNSATTRWPSAHR